MPDIVTSQTFSDGEKGITATKMNNIIANSVIQTDFFASKPASSTLDPTDQLLELKGAGTYARITGSQIASSVAGQLPLADATQNGMLRQVSGLTTDVVDGTNHCVPVASMPGITQMRLRSFNALGNSTFECDQVNLGQFITAPAAGTRLVDRWFFQKFGTLAANAGQRLAAANEVLVPNTNFAISRNYLRITLATAQASLGAGDNLTLYTQIEGSSGFRELQYDVHSVSLLVRSSVAGLIFGLSIRDPATTTKSIVYSCTIPSANTWTLITLPNIPVFPSGTFSTAPGTLGYLLSICLAAGTTLTASANGTWLNTNVLGANGQSNFAASPVSSTFEIAFAQHEPGPLCTTLIDEPFVQNYDKCLRYFQKSYPYPLGIGSSGSSYGMFNSITATAGAFVAYGTVRFPKALAKTATVTMYHHSTGAVNAALGFYATSGTIPNTSGPFAISAVGSSAVGISSINSTGTSPSPVILIPEWTADTGW